MWRDALHRKSILTMLSTSLSEVSGCPLSSHSLIFHLYGVRWVVESVCPVLLTILPWKQRIMQYFRYLLNDTTIINPFIMYPAHRAKAILLRTPNTQSIIPGFIKARPTYCSKRQWTIKYSSAKKETMRLML